MAESSLRTGGPARPRAFVFSREYPPNTVGGTSTVARNLSVGLTAEGWDVVVITTDPGRERDSRELVGGVTVHRVATGGVVYNRDSGLGDDSMLIHRRLHRAADGLAGELGTPDVVALPDLFCYPEAALFAGAHHRPLVNILLQDFRTLTRHDEDKHHVTRGVSADRSDLFDVEEKSLRGCDHVVFISHALADAITGYYPDLPTPHSVVYLGVDAAEIASVAADDAERARLRATLPEAARGRPLLVACGRLVPVKGFAELLRAVAAVFAAGGTGHLVIIGIGPEEGRLRMLAGRLGIDDRVTFAGDIPRREALAWMSAATVGVVPSLWESFCYVCAEMLALGVPVVASAVDSLNELIPTDGYGYRIPVTSVEGRRALDPAALAGAIAACLADPLEARRRAAAGRARILDGFTNDRFAVTMAALCGRLAEVPARG